MERLRSAAAYIGMITARATAHRSSLAAGGLAYFVALSVAPAALVVGWIVGIFVSPQELRDSLTAAAARTPGLLDEVKPTIDAMGTIAEHASASAVSLTTVIGALIALYAASKTVIGLRMALNTAFGVPDRYRGLWERVAATVITLVAMLVVVAVILILTFLPPLLAHLGLDVRLTSGVWIVDWAVTAIVIWLACWGVIARAPNHAHRVPWWAPGPMVAALWIIGASVGVGLYARFSSSLGAAVAIFGSAIVLLVWLYLGFLGLLYGAEIEAERQGRDAATART